MNTVLKPWVVVQHAGLVTELIVCECDTYNDADTAQHELYTDSEREELFVDIMKRLPNGELTTEY